MKLTELEGLAVDGVALYSKLHVLVPEVGSHMGQHHAVWVADGVYVAREAAHVYYLVYGTITRTPSLGRRLPPLAARKHNNTSQRYVWPALRHP